MSITIFFSIFTAIKINNPMKVLELSSLLLSAGFLATAMSPAVLSTNKAEDAKEFTTVGDQYNQLVPLGNNYENHALLEGNNAARRRRSSSVSRLSSSISAGDDSSYSDSDSDGERFVNGITRINQALMATGDDDGDDDEAAAAVFEGLTCGTCFSNSGHSRSRFHQETVLAEPITKVSQFKYLKVFNLLIANYDLFLFRNPRAFLQQPLLVQRGQPVGLLRFKQNKRKELVNTLHQGDSPTV